MINYIIYVLAVGSAIIVGLLLKQPLLPEEPKRQSWTLSAIFPTAVLALGFTAMISKLGYLTNSNMDYLIAVFVGVLTAIFSKFIMEKILPRPPVGKKTTEEPLKKSSDENAPEELHE